MTMAETFHLDSVLPAHATRAPVLCLHGLHAGSWAFEEMLPLIAARGHPAHAISYRGHAPNPALTDIGRQSLSDFAADAEAAARSLGRPIVIGHSMGGLIALLLASRDMVQAVVLVSSAPPRWIPALTPTLVARMPRYLASMLFSRPFMMSAKDIDELALNCIPAGERGEVRARFTPDSGRAVRQMALGVYSVPRRSIRVPMLVMGADSDRFIPLSVAERIARKYDAPLHVARGHGHMLFGERGWGTQAAIMLDWIGALQANQPATEGIHSMIAHSTHRN
jgi:non-heme chloroperoxidase